METIIVFMNDADYAVKLLGPMLPQPAQPPTRWVLVACAPRFTRHISKWVTPSARAEWQDSWADSVFAQVLPQLQNPHRPLDSVITQVAPAGQGLCGLTEALMRQHSARHVLDARRPKLGQNLLPVIPSQKQESNAVTGYAAALAGAALLVGLD